MKALFDAIAPQYDLVNSLATFGLWHRWNKRLVDEVIKEARSSTSILDVCTGTGEIPFHLCRAQFPESCSAKGKLSIDCLDFSPCMLAQAKIKLENFPSCSFIQADATAIPKPSGTYDLITISYGLRNLPLEKSVQELYRVLKPQGSLFILDLTPSSSSFVRMLHSVFLALFVTAVGILCTHRKAPYTYLRKSIQKFPIEKVTQALQQAGFTSIIVERFLLGTVSLIKAKK